MPGRTSGDRKKLSATRAATDRLRARPSAASVPNTTPNRVDRAATSSVLPAARWIWRDWLSSNSCWYHCSEKPVGGNFSDWWSVKDRITTMITGVTMITTASSAIAPITKP